MRASYSPPVAQKRLGTRLRSLAESGVLVRGTHQGAGSAFQVPCRVANRCVLAHILSGAPIAAAKGMFRRDGPSTSS